MYAARAAKPKLTLSTSAAQNSLSLPLKSPITATPRTPISPAAASPSARRFSTFQQQQPPPAPYAYSNPCSSKSILKKHHGARTNSHAADRKRLQFKNSPTVYCVTPIENPEEYYGSHHKVSRDERRWMRRE